MRENHLWTTQATAPRLGATLAVIDADRRLRGPYTAGGAVMRAIAPDLLRDHQDLVRRHDVELVATAPELARHITPQRATLMATAAPEERTRYYPAAYTARLANGITDLLLEYMSRRGDGPHAIVVDNAERAEPTDLEWLAILLRRANPRLLQLVVRTGGQVAEPLATALSRYATRTDDVAAPGHRPHATVDLFEARTTDEHDRLADELAALGEFSLHLGAIPYHRERGSDPRGAGADAVERALQHCVMQGFYESVIDFGRRVLALVDWDDDPERCWLATVKMCTALAALNRPAEAEELYDEACRRSTLPSVHLHAAYGRAMLYTRFYGERRDHARAKGLINTAIAIASLGSEQQRRAYNITFQENGRALVEMHLGNFHESLRLVESGLARLGEEVEPGRFTPHRSVLTYNRAQLLARIGSTEDAIAAYDDVITMDPNHSEYYVERAGLYRSLGLVAEASRDYQTAIELSPPYPQVHFNRGDLAMENGDFDLAIADFDRVLELDDTLVEGYLNRASCHLELDDVDEAAQDVAAGLALDDTQPELHCLLGMIEQRRGRASEARQSFRTALGLDPSLVSGWANLGVLAFDEGDAETALECFNQALAIDDDPVVRANRGIAHDVAGHHDQAIEDFGIALAQAGPGDAGELLFRRGICLVHAGDRDAAVADLLSCVSADDTEYAAKARAELAHLDVR
jgi:tetratricopeptide (TPR) repeat protein